jgi:hypothetical protein
MLSANKYFADISKERNKPLFYKHIHVKIRRDNTQVVIFRSFSLYLYVGKETRTSSLSAGFICKKVDRKKIHFFSLYAPVVVTKSKWIDLCMLSIRSFFVMSNKLKQINQATMTNDHLFSFISFCVLLGAYIDDIRSLISSFFIDEHQPCTCTYIVQAPDCRLQKKKVNLFLLLIWDVYVCCVFPFFFLYEWKSNHHHRLFYSLCFN